MSFFLMMIMMKMMKMMKMMSMKCLGGGFCCCCLGVLAGVAGQKRSALEIQSQLNYKTSKVCKVKYLGKVNLLRNTIH